MPADSISRLITARAKWPTYRNKVQCIAALFVRCYPGRWAQFGCHTAIRLRLQASLARQIWRLGSTEHNSWPPISAICPPFSATCMDHLSWIGKQVRLASLLIIPLAIIVPIAESVSVTLRSVVNSKPCFSSECRNDSQPEEDHMARTWCMIQ